MPTTDLVASESAVEWPVRFHNWRRPPSTRRVSRVHRHLHRQFPKAYETCS
jgi:hypothetical protein